MSKVTISARDEAPVLDPKPENETRICRVPTFREEQVNKRLDDNDQPTGEIISLSEVLGSNMSANIDASLSAFGEEETMLWLCIAQKKDGQHHIATLGTAVKDEKKLVIDVSKLEIRPEITIVGKR